MATTAEHSKGIGEAVLRKEDSRFLTGRGRYVDDIKIPGMLHMAVVRSQYAHADINGIDTHGRPRHAGCHRCSDRR